MRVHPATQARPDHVEVRLDDGQVAALRPLRQHESQPLLEVFDGLSSLSRARRYLTGMPQMPPSLVRRLSDVGSRDRVAWLATIDGEPVGIGRYAAYDHRVVDLALEVVDRWHGRGLGGVLLDAVATVACAHGFTTVSATVHPANHASIRLLRRVGLTLQVIDGLLEGQGLLRLPDPPRVDRRSVLEIARAGSVPGLNRCCAGEESPTQ